MTDTDEEFQSADENEENFIDIINKYEPNNSFDSETKKVYSINWNFLKHCKKWGPNRNIDKLHLKKLVNFFKNQLNNNTNINLPGNIIAGYNKVTNNFIIIDGQHRLNTLKILDKQHDFNCIITLELYIGTDELFKDIFEQINFCKPVNIEKLYLDKFIELKNFFNKEFTYKNKNILRVNTRRPFIDENELWNKLIDSSIFLNSNFIDVKKYIYDINHDYSQDKELKKYKKLTKNIIKTMEDYECYLGIDINFNWIKILEKKISI